MKRPIAIGLSPNTKRQDVLKALRMLVSPWLYIDGSAIKQLEQWFRNFFGVSYAISFNSGRSALVAALKGVGVREGDEVLLQAFTCVAVPNAVLEIGAKPVYVDISDSLTVDSRDLAKKITSKTKAIIVQHTFGIPTDMEAVLNAAKNIPIIEDCAHTVGGLYQNKKLGTFGDAAIFSFGRDKAFSSVFGGMAITNDKTIGKKIRAFQKDKNFPSFFWVFQQLLHPIAFAIILPLYTIGIGKILLVLLQKLRLLSFPVFPIEKKGKMEKGFVQKMPNALASLALLQLRRVNEYNRKREQFTAMYIKELADVVSMPVTKRLPLLRFPIFIAKRDSILSSLKKEGIYLGNWYANVIDPKDVDFNAVLYKRGMCPNAEKLSLQIINLPTHPTMTVTDAQKVIAALKNYAHGTKN